MSRVVEVLRWRASGFDCTKALSDKVERRCEAAGRETIHHFGWRFEIALDAHREAAVW